MVRETHGPQRAHERRSAADFLLEDVGAADEHRRVSADSTIIIIIIIRSHASSRLFGVKTEVRVLIHLHPSVRSFFYSETVLTAITHLNTSSPLPRCDPCKHTG